MVGAILDGRKRQTRRIVKNIEAWEEIGCIPLPEQCPYGVAGDRLWVREVFAKRGDDEFVYRADFRESDLKMRSGIAEYLTWKPSIQMPRRTSRITLEITKVRVDRVQQHISEEDAKAEGVEAVKPYPINVLQLEEKSYVAAYAILWDSLHKKPNQWEDNPWIWAIEFKRIKP